MRSFIVYSNAVTLLVAVLAGPASLAATASGYDYKDALAKNLLFFEAQRSGKLPAGDQRVQWRGDSGLNDGFPQGVDLVGGYYDSGDHVKFGLPMAFAVTMLSWGVIEFEKEIAASNQLERTLDAIKWGTDYFLKAHPQPNVLWVQVGDGDTDHHCWERAEDMTTSRTAYKIDTGHPGSDIAAETAAALAAASIAFKPYNSSYSKLLLLHSEQLFSFADTFRGQYDDSIPSVQVYYPSSGYSDELLWAAAWLYHATDDRYYIKYVVDNSASLGGTGWAVREFSWDNKYAGVQVLLAKVLMEDGTDAYDSVLKQYQAKAEFFLCACLQKNNGYNVQMTSVYSDYLSMTKGNLNCPEGQVQPQEILKFAQSQADYILGKNPSSFSYLVGYGNNYPAHVHHRGASIQSTHLLASPIGCTQGFEQWFTRQESNPNVIVGALVGGPNQQDEFSDQRNNYEQTEPSLAANGPLVGLLAKLDSAYQVPESYSPRSVAKEDLVAKKSPAGEHHQTNYAPVEFAHTLTHTWMSNGASYYRHKVVAKNISPKPITQLRLSIENLTGPLWGLSPTSQKNLYEFPHWIKVLKPGSQFDFVYVQGGPPATVSVVSYH
ncbi:hypothetical protein Taro_053683 [Colocasia esculenta]|uniref:Endoglucanase n=1 Tax=Colocasia esculenta TaxID=4460 RepID=A0A843XLW8_COLES|nr:hypothetical protein [Colocasia esculenta]